MKNKRIELVLSHFIDNELISFTSQEFKEVFFTVCGNDLTPSYLEGSALSTLRFLSTLKCIKLVGTGNAKIYALNHDKIKKLFLDLIPEIRFDKKGKK